MKSTIELANLLNDSVDILSNQSKPFESNPVLKKALHDIAVNISIIALNTGAENSKKEIVQKLNEVTDSITILLKDKQLKDSENIIKTLSQILDWVLEYRKALDAPRESYESKVARIQQLNKEFRAFQYTDNNKMAVFSSGKVQDETKSNKISKDSKKEFANGISTQSNGHHREEAASQPISTGPTTNKKSM